MSNEIGNLFMDLSRTYAALAKAHGATQGGIGVAPAGNGATRQAAIANDADLDGERGDPQVKFDPKRWNGESFKGAHYSECPPEYLAELASFLEWSASKPLPGKEKYAAYDARDAGLARAWIKRMTSGTVATPQRVRESTAFHPGGAGLSDTRDPGPTDFGGADDDSIPFDRSDLERV